MVAVVVGNEHAVNVIWAQFQACKALGQLSAAESLVDQDLRVWCFEQGRVSSTAGTQVRDGHRHANIFTPTREGLEYTA